MYDAVKDPYCYPGTTVLRNIPKHLDQDALDAFELASTTQRADEPLPPGRLSVRHYCAVHHHLFQDVYTWAGRFRTIRFSKDNSVFCYPENIAREMRKLFKDLQAKRHFRELDRTNFTTASSSFLATLNAIHPFREGNGRAQMAFMALLSDRAGHALDLTRLQPDAFLNAMIASFAGNEEPLVAQMDRLTA